MEHAMSKPRCFIVLVLLVTVSGMAPPAAAQIGFEPPRLADGRPDLQGVWDFRTLTPLERPADRADQPQLTPEEAAAIEAAAVQRAIEADRPTAVRTAPLPAGGSIVSYNDFWNDRVVSVVDDRRTSLIVDPPDGRIPSPRPEAPRQLAVADGDHAAPPNRPVRFMVGGIGLDGPEDRGLAERCLLGFNSGPPIVPVSPRGRYNQNLQLFQTPDHVVVFTEMVHEARIVPLDGRDPLPNGIRQWTGSSRGRWEGDTLVVETTNFTDKTASFVPFTRLAIGTGRTLHLTERFRLVRVDTLLYEFTIDDPASFTRPFTAGIPMRRSTAPLFEYACHEGNYAMRNLLAGARATGAHPPTAPRRGSGTPAPSPTRPDADADAPPFAPASPSILLAD